MSKIDNIAQAASDSYVDALDTVLGSTSRAGSSIERVAKMRKAGVSKNVTAMQMTENSSNGTQYTVQDVETCEKIYADCKTKVVMTKAQATALMKNQRTSNTSRDNNISDLSPEPENN